MAGQYEVMLKQGLMAAKQLPGVLGRKPAFSKGSVASSICRMNNIDELTLGTHMQHMYSCSIRGIRGIEPITFVFAVGCRTKGDGCGCKLQY
jgi:hypothetical protein